MKYLKLFPLVLISFLAFSFSNTAEAFNPNKLPVSQKSEHWNIQIGKDEEKAKSSNNGVFNTYSLDIKNIGEEAYNVTVEVYRNEPNVQRKFELFTLEKPHLANLINGFHHPNFPVSINSNEIEVTVTWQDEQYKDLKYGKKGSARKYKETFTFKDK